nr:MAG TPA: hypothetical protein [Caudoviricetes sp.]
MKHAVFLVGSKFRLRMKVGKLFVFQTFPRFCIKENGKKKGVML